MALAIVLIAEQSQTVAARYPPEAIHNNGINRKKRGINLKNRMKKVPIFVCHQHHQPALLI
ncbi:hypothetical protein LU604_24160 [Erwinia tracheiphila]|uniref:hypothetical protein n=1 Tax=Erwinia tracheiphila TaxID=65700 RepID=UPI001F344C4B|nr:hypothetical protein [Erwinia tracheiphila]UIA83358.1 hypothetical protein LU604_24160 [Erwinia tracheiphila]